MNRSILAGTVIILMVAIGFGVAFLLTGPYLSMVVPPPSEPPGNEVEAMVLGDLRINATAYFYQDHMPIIPEEGPPFSAFIEVAFTNLGRADYKLQNFSAIRMTIYYNGTLEPLVTFSLFLSYRTELPQNIEPGDSVVLSYADRRNDIFAPEIEEGTYLYGRITFTWNHINWYTLTTPPSAVQFTY